MIPWEARSLAYSQIIDPQALSPHYEDGLQYLNCPIYEFEPHSLTSTKDKISPPILVAILAEDDSPNLIYFNFQIY